MKWYPSDYPWMVWVVIQVMKTEILECSLSNWETNGGHYFIFNTSSTFWPTSYWIGHHCKEGVQP